MSISNQVENLSEISQIINANHPIDVYRYIIFCKKGIIAFNETLGVLYKRDHLPSFYRAIIDKYDGSFAVPDANLFSRVNSLIKNSSSIEVYLSLPEQSSKDVLIANKSLPGIQVNFNDASSKMKVRIPVILDVSSEYMPQLTTEWPDSVADVTSTNTVKAGVFMDAFKDIKDHTNASREDILSGWDSIIGAYCIDGYLHSFSKNTALLSEEAVDCPDFYCPLKFVQLVAPNLDAEDTLHITDDGQVFLNTPTKIFMTRFKNHKNHLARVKEFFNIAEDTTVVDVDFFNKDDLADNLYKGGKSLSSNSPHVLLIKNHTLIIHTDTWQGICGEINHPDNQFPGILFSTLISWTNGDAQKLLHFADNDYHIIWRTARGMKALATLPPATQNTKLVAEIQDAGDGETLL